MRKADISERIAKKIYELFDNNIPQETMLRLILELDIRMINADFTKELITKLITSLHEEDGEAYEDIGFAPIGYNQEITDEQAITHIMERLL